MNHECKHHNVVHTNHSVVCTDCGLERNIFENYMDYSQSLTSAPLTRCYSRCDRWIAIVKKVVGIHGGPTPTKKVWQYLHKRKDTFECPQDIVNTLRKSGLKNKHYPCLHMFCKAFCKNYKKPSPDPGRVLNMLTTYFEHIQQLWNRYRTPEDQFFSYNWLIEQALHMYNFKDYFPYNKKLKCIHRRKRYVDLLLKLYETRVGRRSRNTLNTRPRCANNREVIPRNQLQTLLHLEKQSSEARQAAELGGSQLDRLYKYAKSLGILERS